MVERDLDSIAKNRAMMAAFKKYNGSIVLEPEIEEEFNREKKTEYNKNIFDGGKHQHILPTQKYKIQWGRKDRKWKETYGLGCAEKNASH